MNWIATLSQGEQTIASLLLALVGVCTALSALFGFLGAWVPSFTKAGAIVGRFGIALHDLAEAFGRFFPGTTPPPGGQGPSRENAQVPTAPPTPRNLRTRLVAFVGAVSTAIMLLFCSPAQSANLQRVERVVLSDLAKGDGAEQIESDIASIYEGQPGVDVVVILNDALTLLEDLGVIPKNVIPQASSVHTAVHAQLAVRSAK